MSGKNLYPIKICLIPRTEGVGGMVSFQNKFADGLKKRGMQVTQDVHDRSYDALLVIGGTHDLLGLWQAKRCGLPIIQRLDGMNWLHRLGGPQKMGLQYFLRAEYGNLLLSTIRSRFASRIVYQSQFSRRWWKEKHGQTEVPSTVIHNGVDLAVYSPDGDRSLPQDCWRILMVEGSLMGGYEQGLQAAFKFVENLAAVAPDRAGSLFPGLVELMVVGRLADDTRETCERWRLASPFSDRMRLNWAGLKPSEAIPTIDRSAHLLYSSDINPACPNSVIEALACGLPVIGFDTGALPELIDGSCGWLVPYGGDPWRLDPPDVTGLAEAALSVLVDPAPYQRGARLRAETLFGLDQMVDRYLDFMLEGDG